MGDWGRKRAGKNIFQMKGTEKEELSFRENFSLIWKIVIQKKDIDALKIAEENVS